MHPRGYIILILKIQEKKKNQWQGSPLNPETQQKKSHRLNQQRTQRAPSPLKSNTFWVTTRSCWHYLKWPMIANGESVVLPVTSSLLGFCFWLVHYSASCVSNSWVFGVLWLSVSQMSDCSELSLLVGDWWVTTSSLYENLVFF